MGDTGGTEEQPGQIAATYGVLMESLKGFQGASEFLGALEKCWSEVSSDLKAVLPEANHQ